MPYLSPLQLAKMESDIQYLHDYIAYHTPYPIRISEPLSPTLAIVTEVMNGWYHARQPMDETAYYLLASLADVVRVLDTRKSNAG